MTVREIEGLVCFPVDHKCYDPHGKGDGKKIEVDCFTGGGRVCNPTKENWPECNNGTFTPL